ncbi:MAG: response regulator [bacterium]
MAQASFSYDLALIGWTVLLLLFLGAVAWVDRIRRQCKKTTIELKRLQEELQRADVMKGHFIASASHELRTPLSGIIGMTDLLMKTAMTDEQQEFAETIRVSGEALLAVVNDILDFAKIEADKMVAEAEPFVLQRCVEEAVRLVTPAATKKKLELICQIDEHLAPTWIGDVGRLRQVLVNLLGNAIKFTERGEVVISVTGQTGDNDPSQLDFAVRDSGVGIPLEQQSKLFQAFSQVDASSSRRLGGTGLGLAVSKRLCELMGGEMSVESQGIPGQGATFRFSIRVTRATAADPPAVMRTLGVLAGKRVLIVDDNVASCDFLKHQTEAWKMIPAALTSGKAALDCLETSGPFDLGVLDATLPEMSGLKLVDAIRSRPGQDKLPLIVLLPMGDHVTGGERARIDACLSKPVFASRLHDALANLLGAPPVPQDDKAKQLQMPFDGETAKRYPLQILLAEDNIANQKVVASTLAKFGYRVDVVANGSDAVAAAKRTPYDLILMDVLMPELDGLQATSQIRKEVPAENQPWIVAMTANVMKGDRERYLLGGMNDYLSKPIRGEFLAEVLRTVQPLASRAAQVATDARQA